MNRYIVMYRNADESEGMLDYRRMETAFLMCVKNWKSGEWQNWALYEIDKTVPITGTPLLADVIIQIAHCPEANYQELRRNGH